MTVKERLSAIKRLLLLPGIGARDVLRFAADERVLRAAIGTALQRIVREHRVTKPGTSYLKYLDTDLWVTETLTRAYHLRLHVPGPRLRVLDLGTGMGYFPFICGYYGHHPEALDVETNPIYNEATAALGVRRHVQRIEHDGELLIPGRFDLITAFMICFNNHRQPDVWGGREWWRFLRRLADRNAAAGARIVLSFNRESEAELASGDVLELLERCGAGTGGGEGLFVVDAGRIPERY